MRISDWSSDVCSSDLNSEGSMNAQHRCDAHKNVDIQGKFAVLARLLSPAMKGRARRVSENEPALLFAETPEVRDRQERAEVWSAQTTTIRSEEHTSELQSLMRISYAVFCLKKKTLLSQKSLSETT